MFFINFLFFLVFKRYNPLRFADCLIKGVHVINTKAVDIFADISYGEGTLLGLCIYLAIGCSMRIGEILGLTWDCIHIEDELCEKGEAYLTVNKELRRVDRKSVKDIEAQGRNEIYLKFPSQIAREIGAYLVLKTPKTSSSKRDIYIPGAVIKELKTHKVQQNSLKETFGAEYNDYDLVIAQNNGNPIEGRIIDEQFCEFIGGHDLPKVVFHSLRHSSTSLKLRISGGDIKAVQGDTGHAQSNMVTDVYSHIMNEDRRQLAMKMDSEFFSLREQKKEPADDLPDEKSKLAYKMLQESPELADIILKMSAMFQSKQG